MCALANRNEESVPKYPPFARTYLESLAIPEEYQSDNKLPATGNFLRLPASFRIALGRAIESTGSRLASIGFYLFRQGIELQIRYPDLSCNQTTESLASDTPEKSNVGINPPQPKRCCGSEKARTLRSG